MDFPVKIIFALILLAVNGSSYAVLPGEMYWKSKLPTTPLPKALQEFLQPITANKRNRSWLAEDQTTNRASYNVAYRPRNTAYSQEFRGLDKNFINNEATIFFLYNDLHPYQKMKLCFTKSINGSHFLPRKMAESMPFSSNKSQEILNYFGIKPTSKAAQIIKRTIEECEAPSIRGEVKYCATSFESLVDLVVAKFGKKVRAFVNEVEEENKKQEYTILGVKKISDNQIVCHKQIYEYAVYYCHSINATTAYSVSLVGDDGSKVKAAGICHFDTSTWNPKHFAFQVLNVKVGGPPICHFLNSDTVVWVSI